MSTHINAKKGDFAKIVLMPGDPLRAKYIASKYLENVKEVTNVRNVLGYTGTYKNKLISVMASGMGISSMSIYCYELFKEYDVDCIIRIGTCGAYNEKLRLKDTIAVSKAYTDSNYAYNFNSKHENMASSSEKVMHKLIESAKNNDIELIKGNILTSEVFYRNNSLYKKYIDEGLVLGVEMECFSLFYTASVLGKEAGALLTVSDYAYPFGYKELSAKEREKSLDDMILIALESILL